MLALFSVRWTGSLHEITPDRDAQVDSFSSLNLCCHHRAWSDFPEYSVNTAQCCCAELNLSVILYRCTRESKLPGIDLKVPDSQSLHLTPSACSAAGRTCDTHTENPASLQADWTCGVTFKGSAWVWGRLVGPGLMRRPSAECLPGLTLCFISWSL